MTERITSAGLLKLATELFATADTPAHIAISRNQGKANWHGIAHGLKGEFEVWGTSLLETKRRLRDGLVGLLVLRKHGRLITREWWDYRIDQRVKEDPALSEEAPELVCVCGHSWDRHTAGGCDARLCPCVERRMVAVDSLNGGAH